MARPQNELPHRLISLRRRFLWLLVGVVGLFTAGMTLSLVFSLHSSKVAESRLIEVEAGQTQSSVMRRWDYYREILDNQARDPNLINLMTRGSADEMQQWAMDRKSLLPNTRGLALVSAQGEIYGDAGALGLEPSCLGVLRQTAPSVQAPIHRGTPGQEHVDLFSIVRNAQGEVLGKVFLSMRLIQMQRVVDDSTQPGHAITLLDSLGEPIVSSGFLAGKVIEINVPLTAMEWSLKVQAPVQRLSTGGWLQILAGALTLVSVLILLVVAVLRMRRPVLQDIHAALDALACLTRNESAPPIKTRYIEFSPAAEDINRIAQQLHDQREQLATLSLTDALTGLPNRRAFEVQFPHMLGLADRGHDIALVLLDVDHFKAINDQFGHAAGDQALIVLANTLKALTRSADMTSRLAGDEFTVLLSGLDKEGVVAWYERLADRYKSELRAAGLTVDSTISAGQTWLQRMVGDSIGKALARADHALYQAKARGRAQLVLDDAVRENDAG